MLTALHFVGSSFVVIVLILDIVFAAEIILGLTAPALGAEGGERVDVAIVIPANDEAIVIGDTLAALRQVVWPEARIVVIADNCSDLTASIAQSTGAEVVVRFDPDRRGKGYALACARDTLRLSPPAVVVVIDADCRIDTASFALIVQSAIRFDRAVQAVSLLAPDLGAAPLVQVSNFAFAVKNRLRNAGLQHITGGALLTGTGMAFPWHIFEAAPLATDNVVEDLALGLYLSDIGSPPLLTTRAEVYSPASTSAGTLVQRSRWERGFLATSWRHGIPHLVDATARLNGRAVWSATSLLIPPFSLLLLLNLAICSVTFAFWVRGGSPVLTLLIGGANVILSAAILSAWHRIGRRFVAPAAALALPSYVLCKIPLYLAAIVRKPKSWLRTGR